MPSHELNLTIALKALGEILASQNQQTAIVVVGGTALILQGFISRTTSDVDVIALGRLPFEGKRKVIKPPDPLPEFLVEAIARVARDFNLPADWMNTMVAMQWDTGLPDAFQRRIHWKQLGGLWLGLADRYDLIFLKFYATADSEGPASVHYQDLMALAPTNDELEKAARWARKQDPSEPFGKIVGEVLEYVKQNK